MAAIRIFLIIRDAQDYSLFRMGSDGELELAVRPLISQKNQPQSNLPSARLIRP
jgi:hypothetical protein